MPVDVLTGTVIDRRRALVAAYAADPSNAPEWYENIEAAEWKTPPPLRVGLADSPASSRPSWAPRCVERHGRTWRGSRG